MKVCLVNVNNCINYSQYGPFFFEHIKDKSCVIYNGVTHMGDLSGLYDFLVAEYNRNAFVSKKMKLLFVISRDMLSMSVEESEFFAKINIYKQIISVLSFFSSVEIIFIDKTPEEKEGALHRRESELCESMITCNSEYAEYLPFCKELDDWKKLEDGVNNINHPVCKAFAREVFETTPREMEGRYNNKNIYAHKCAEKLSGINVAHILVKPDDVSDRISKTVKVIYFIKALIGAQDGNELPVSELEDFKFDEQEARVLIKTYKHRLENWLEGSYEPPLESIYSKKVFSKRPEEYQNFKMQIDKIIDEDLVYLERISSKFRSKPKKEEIKRHDAANGKRVDELNSIVDETFEKLEKIVKHAKDEVAKFADNKEAHFFDQKNAYTEESVTHKEINKIDLKNDNDDLLEKLNRYELFSPPGMTELISLEQKLEKINDKIHTLLECKKVYKMKAFILTFLFAFIAVIGIYWGVQSGVIMANKAFLTFAVYAAIIGIGFFAIYALLMNFYKKQVFLLLKKCKKEVSEYLTVCKEMALDFDNNVNAVADFVCHNKFIEELEKREAERDITLMKFEWHKRKVREILRNLNHFNDYIKDIRSLESKENVNFENYDNDAEHTEFYQMRFFEKGK